MRGFQIGLIGAVFIGCGAAPSASSSHGDGTVAPKRAHTHMTSGRRVAAAIDGGVVAKPVRYTGFTVTDGQLGAWAFHNARVYLMFDTDASNAQFTQVAPDPTDPTFTVDTYINATGVASIRVVTDTQDVSAVFDPNQIFVSADVGDTSGAPHYGARGVGFGSFSATAPGGIEPAYPLGIEDGTLDWGDVVGNGTASAALQNLTFDLASPLAVSGRAWSCLGFPDNSCPKPTTALTTDHGDLFLYQPYQIQYLGQGDDPMGAGFFIVEDRSTHKGEEADNRAEETVVSAPKGGEIAESHVAAPRRRSPITYNAYTIADVTLGCEHFSGAQVYLSFDSDAANVVPFNRGGQSGYMNSIGAARARIVSSGRTYQADFAPNQLFVFYDVANSYLGFGSTAGGFGYPLSLTSGNADPDGLTNQSLMGAVTDIANGTIPSGDTYPTETYTLGTNLVTATTLSGPASSCTSLDPVTASCANLTPVALQTNRGDFLLSEPYTVIDNNPDGGAALPPHTINWGVFWTDGVKAKKTGDN